MGKPRSALAKALERIIGEPFWKNPWRAKVTDRIEHVKAIEDGVHILVCIKGGPACDWERTQFHQGGFVSTFYADHDLHLKECNDVLELRQFLLRNAPLAESQLIT